MRTGQANGKLGCSDVALQKFKISYDIAKAFEATGAVFSDSLPKADYQHIQAFLPVLYGYELWKKQSTYNENEPEHLKTKISILLQAYSVTLEALGVSDNQKMVLNNLVYYAMDIASLTSKFDIEPTVTLSELESHLDSLLSVIDFESCDDIFELDTIAKAYHLLGRPTEAHKAVDKIISCTLDRGKTSTYDELGLEIAQEAYEMKKKFLAA